MEIPYFIPLIGSKGHLPAGRDVRVRLRHERLHLHILRPHQGSCDDAQVDGLLPLVDMERQRRRRADVKGWGDDPRLELQCQLQLGRQRLAPLFRAPQDTQAGSPAQIVFGWDCNLQDL